MAVNVGGALIPALVSLYLCIRMGIYVRIVLANGGVALFLRRCPLSALT